MMNLAPHDDDTLSQAAPPMPAVAPAARNARRLLPKRFDLPSTRGLLGDESKTFTHA
jgi:hypothetical protein